MLWFRRFGIFLVITSALIGAGLLAGRFFPRHRSVAAGEDASLNRTPDTAGRGDWRKRDPWLYRESAYAPFADALLRPWFALYGLDPTHLVKHSGYLEALLPRGKPIHEYAYDLETLCGQAGIRVRDGRELDPPGRRVEYHLQAASGPVLTLRAALATPALRGAVRLAVVVMGLDTVSADAARRLLACPFPLTLVVNAESSGVSPRVWTPLPEDKELLTRLPMEPSAYPYVKPGPGALYIHYSRSEVNRVLDAKMRASPRSRGFATRLGDRAIENRPLMLSLLEYTAHRHLVFLDLTASPRSLAGPLSLPTGAMVYAARVAAPEGDDAFDEELARRCGLAQKTGDGIWALSYTPGLAEALERVRLKYEDRFDALGLEWTVLDSLRTPALKPARVVR